MIDLESHREGTIIPVKALPGSAKPGVRGEHGGMLKLAVREVAEKGKANAGLTSALAELFSLAKANVELLSGDTASHKRFLLRGLSREAAAETLQAALEHAATREKKR